MTVLARTRLLRIALWISASAMGLGPSLAAAPAHALPVISEVLYDGPGADNGQSFVELYGDPGTPLDGLVLEGVNGSNGAVGPVVELFGLIPDDGVFVVADDAGDGTSFVLTADLIAEFDFQNGPDSIVLRGEDGVLDAVGYGDFGPEDVFAGEGLAAPDPMAGFSIAREFADVDTDDNAVDFVALDIPTPGSVELLVPEPASGAMLLAALGVLAVFGRLRRR